MTLKLHVFASVAHHDLCCTIFPPEGSHLTSTVYRIVRACSSKLHVMGSLWTFMRHCTMSHLSPPFPLRCWPFQHWILYSVKWRDGKKNTGSVYWVTLFHTSDRPFVLCSAFLYEYQRCESSSLLQWHRICTGRARTSLTAAHIAFLSWPSMERIFLPRPSVPTSRSHASHVFMIFQRCLAPGFGKCPCPAS